MFEITTIPRDTRMTKRTRIGLALLVPILIAEAICIGTLSKTGQHHAPNTVVINTAADRSTNSVDQKITAELSRTPGFNWKISHSVDPVSAIGDKPLLAIVVIRATRSLVTPGGQQSKPITVIPGRIGPASETYPRLLQAVFEVASRVGIAEILDSVSAARVKLNVASFTSAGIDGAVTEAGSTLDQARHDFNELLAQSAPILESTRALLGSFQSSVGAMTSLADKLSEFASSIKTLDVTLGDLNDSAELGQGALNKVAPFLPQFEAIGRFVAESLQRGSAPGLESLGAQISAVIRLTTGESLDPPTLSRISDGVSLVSADELSGLLDAPVDRNTRISDFMFISGHRLRSIAQSINSANQDFGRVSTLLASSRVSVGETTDSIGHRMEDFKRAVTTLNSSLNGATKALPIGDFVSESVQLAMGFEVNAETLYRASILILIGALGIVLAMGSLTPNRERSLRLSLWLTGAICISAFAVSILGLSANLVAVLVISWIAAFVSIGIYFLVARAFGRLGLAAATALIAIDAISGDLSEPENGLIGIAKKILPGNYVAELLTSASVGGFSLKIISLMSLFVILGAFLLVVNLYEPGKN